MLSCILLGFQELKVYASSVYSIQTTESLPWAEIIQTFNLTCEYKYSYTWTLMDLYNIYLFFNLKSF